MRKSILVGFVVLLVACSVAKEPLAMTGEWSLKAMPGNDLSKLDKPITLKLDSVTKKASGFAGCNQYFSSYTTQKTSIIFSGIGSTKMFCDQTMGLENKFLEALGKSTDFKVEGTSLKLLQGDLVLLEFQK